MRLRLHHILLALMLAAAAAISARAGADKATTWDDEAARRKAAYVFLDAMADLSAENYTDYTAKLQRATQLDPSDPDIAAEYAELLLQTTQLDSAETEAAYAAMWRRFRANPADYANATAAADVAGKLGKFRDVAAVWQALRDALPGRNDPAINLAETYTILYIQGDSAAFDSAMSIYNSLEQGLGFDIGLSSQKIRALAIHSDTAAVTSELSRISAAAPADPDVAIYTGQMFEKFNMPDSALARYNMVCGMDSTDGRALMLRAQLHLRQGDSAAFDNEVFRALESPNLDFPNKMRMLTSYIRALFEDSTQHERIDRLFDVMREVNPGEPELHTLNAIYLSQTGRSDAAAEQAGYAVDLDPENPELWTMLVQMQARRGDNDAIIDAARRGAQHFPEMLYFPIVGAAHLTSLKRYEEAGAMLDSFDIAAVENPEAASDYWSARGDVAYGMGLRDSSATLYEKAIAVNPHNFMAMNNFAYHLAENDTLLDKAEHYAALAVKSEPENPTYLDTYAWVFFRKKDYTLARRYIDAVLRIMNDETDGEKAYEPSAEVLDHAGDIYFMTGDRKQALDYWKQALELDPDNELTARKVANKTIFFE